MNIDIHEIKAPGLNESDYGTNIDEQFKNIDNNFRIIGNYDFIKGQPGDGVKIENVKIVADDSSKEIGSLLYKALKTAVESFANKSSDTSVALNYIGEADEKKGERFNWDDSITENDFYVPIIIHENKVNNTKEYICSAGVVCFFDNRFSATALKQPNLYNNNIVDVTSLLNFKKKANDEWVCDLNLSFPRLKFKDESFYWVINDQETSIKATGLKGDRGSNGTMVIGRTEYIDKTNSKTEVPVELLVDGKWVDKAPDYLKAGDIITVLCPIKDDSSYTYNGFFISNITKIVAGIAYATYRPEANITQINYSKDTVSFFEALGSQEPVDGAQPARGMFLLFDNFKTTPNGGYAKDDSINDNYAHMIYNDEHKLYISPVNDYKSKNDFSPVVGTNENDTPQLNINYKTNISKALAVTGATSISGGLTVCNSKLSVPADGVTSISGGLIARGNPNSNYFGVSGQISIPSNGNPISILATNGDKIKSEIQCGAKNSNNDGVRTVIFGETLLQAEASKNNNITVHPTTGITINGYTSDSSGINITGVTKIKSSTGSNAKYLKVNDNGVGINIDPNNNYALRVDGDTNISGELTVASAEITGALSAGATTINGDATISRGHARVNKNIYFTDKGGDNNTRYTHNIETLGANNSTGAPVTGGENTSLTIWASTIQLFGNANNDTKNTINLGNGGSVAKNEINIKGKTNISNTLAVNSGGAAISGATTITGALSVTNNATSKVNGISDVTLGCPIGTIVMWSSSNIPEGWLLCDGRGIPSKDDKHTQVADGYEDYEKLYNVLKDNFGENSSYDDIKTGTKSNGHHVSLPDFQRRFPLGVYESDQNWLCGSARYKTNLGSEGGTAQHMLTEREMPSHTHSMLVDTDSDSSHTKPALPDGSTAGSKAHPINQTSSSEMNYSKDTNNSSNTPIIYSAGGGIPHTNIPPFLAINFIIKYK